MASIIENWKHFNTEWRLNNLYDKIQMNTLEDLDKLFIETTLFTEIFTLVNGRELTQDNIKYFKAILCSYNHTLGKKDDIEKRNRQMNLILEIYSKHYKIFKTDIKYIKYAYILVSYVNRIDLTYKGTYLDKLFGFESKKFNNYKFKKNLFVSSIERLQKQFTDNLSLFSMDNSVIDVYDKYELLSTIISIQSLRGYGEEEYYE